MFEREHHRRIATVLQALDAQLLADNDCLFGGGTAIALSHGEYRDSMDIDFLISNVPGYRSLRQRLAGKTDIRDICRPRAISFTAREIRADQYGIRTTLLVHDTEIKLEIVLEGRVVFERPLPSDRICDVATLTRVDMATSKLLANSDRWSDDSVYSRDLIDLAMLGLDRDMWSIAVAKAESAYGASILRDLSAAISALGKRRGRLADCMRALQMSDTSAGRARIAPAVLWKRIRALVPKN